MKKDRLPEIITVITIILFLAFLLTITPSRDELQGGDIQHAIDTRQYK
jgi:hypothetical protein